MQYSTHNSQMLILEPKDVLRFNAPFTTRSTSTLEVTNPTPYSILFKIKTTASFRYYVTPKMGVLLPYSREVVTIGMKAPKGETEDKFKIVAMVAQDVGESTIDFWDGFDESRAMTSKFTVEFIDETHPEHPAQNTKSDEPNAEQQSKRSSTDSIKKIIAFIGIGALAVASRYYSLGNIIQS